MAELKKFKVTDVLGATYTFTASDYRIAGGQMHVLDEGGGVFASFAEGGWVSIYEDKK